MKPSRLISLGLGMAAACALHAADTPRPQPQTDVVFDHPEKFSDVRDRYNPTDEGRDRILSKIRSYLVGRGASLLPGGYKLTITFTDIHLAGDFEPWHGLEREDIRVVKAIYPPSFKFTYSVTDPSGKLVREGLEDIKDLDFQLRLTPASPDRLDPLRYEKDILDDWARQSLRGLKKA